MTKAVKIPPLQEGLLSAMQALDAQVAREMQRSPKDQDLHGVQKWEPFQRRIEDLTTFILDCFGDQKVDLDGLLILSQSFAKSLQLLIADLGQDGLGKIRTQYCQTAMENISADATKSLHTLREERQLM
jgi:hypothetical protein